MFAGKKSAQIREILISESAWEEMTCLFAPSLIVASIYGFIQMNLNFLTLDLFYAGVFCSLAVQLVFTVIQCNCK